MIKEIAQGSTAPKWDSRDLEKKTESLPYQYSYLVDEDRSAQKSDTFYFLPDTTHLLLQLQKMQWDVILLPFLPFTNVISSQQNSSKSSLYYLNMSFGGLVSRIPDQLSMAIMTR